MKSRIAPSSTGSQRYSATLREDTPAYQVLRQHNLLDSTYRLESVEDMQVVHANSDRCSNFLLNVVCFFPLGITGCYKTFEVPAGTVKKVTDGRGGFSFYGPGVRRKLRPGTL